MQIIAVLAMYTRRYKVKICQYNSLLYEKARQFLVGIALSSCRTLFSPPVIRAFSETI